MSTKYRVAEHEVVAVRLAACLPLTVHEKVQPPEVGVVVVLEDGRKMRWLPEGKIPAAGDMMVTDPVLGVAYVIPAEKFVEPLFSAVQEETDHV